VKDRIAALAVGLAADCDKPESEVQSLMRENLPGAGTLPFAGFLTPDLKWVGGWAGYKDEAAVLEVLDAVEKSPLLDAPEAGKKKLAGLAEKAARAAEKGEWKAVLAAKREGADVRGRCAGRDTIESLVRKAHDWADGRFAEAIGAAQAGGDLTPARAALNDVKKQFAGEPEYAEAETGLKALMKLSNILDIETGKVSADPAGLREKAAKDFADGRWARVFEKGGPAPSPAPPDTPK
jgi:hypothetical protein